MQEKEKSVSLLTLNTFGDLLKYLRKRAQLTQRELAIAVGYSEAHITRLEKNQRLPDLSTVAALFVPALGLEEEPDIAAQLMHLAASAHSGESLTISRIRESTEVSQSPESIPSNLPIQLTTFIGRQAESAKITGLISDEKPNRLVTLTGPGGIGKTRLALQTAIGLFHLYPDGVWFVDLAPLSAPELVLQTVTSALSITEIRGQSVEENLIAHLRSKHTLILIDNCEHLIQAAAQLTEQILRSCAHVQILATSREPLHVAGEVNYQIPPLSLPEDQSGLGQTVMGHESVQLFVERARTIHPSFSVTNSNADVIAHICRKLDGMPLAIELAAARINVLSLSQIEARLEDRFRLLTGGQITLPRHQTLRATLEWSHELLSEAEKVLFRRLSVFAGGWTLDSANAVCADQDGDVLDPLTQLVNKSLVVVERQLHTDVRYTMLETIREYACAQLRAAGEMEGLLARHFDYFLRMAQQGEPKLFTAESSLDWAEAEIDNLRTALSWALERDKDGSPSEDRTGPALELMLHVWPLWLSRGYSMEGEGWLNQLLSLHTASTPARARALLLAGDLAGYRRDYAGQAALTQESLTLSQKLGDKKRIAWSLMEMGLIKRDRYYPEAIQYLNESMGLFQELNEELWVCRTSFLLAQTHTTAGNLGEARRLWEQGLILSRAADDKWQIAWGLEGLGDVERLERHFQQAGELYRESLKLRVAVMDKVGIVYSVEAFAHLAINQNQFKRAAVLWGAAGQLRENLNMLAEAWREEFIASSITTARAQLSKKTFAEASAKGRKMDMQEVIGYALTQTIV